MKFNSVVLNHEFNCVLRLNFVCPLDITPLMHHTFPEVRKWAMSHVMKQSTKNDTFSKQFINFVTRIFLQNIKKLLAKICGSDAVICSVVNSRSKMVRSGTYQKLNLLVFQYSTGFKFSFIVSMLQHAKYWKTCCNVFKCSFIKGSNKPEMDTWKR